MEQGLAHQMTYREGKKQNTTHYYAGARLRYRNKTKNTRKTKKKLQ
jgi:hypothetical protein